MPEITFFDLMKRVASKKGEFPFVFLYGYNEFLGDRVIRAFVENFLEGKSDFNFRRFYFDNEENSDWGNIINEANSSSFFIQSRKILVCTVRDTKRLSLQKEDKTILKEYLKNPNNNTIVIFFVSLDLIKDDYKSVKKQKIDKIVKELNSPHCYQVDLDKISEREVKDYVKSYLKKQGLSITASGLDKLIEIKEDDFISILHQLPKLEIAEVEEKRLDSQDIDEIITGVEAHSIWDLTDAIENEDTEKYLKVLHYLFLHGIKPTLILGTLITYYNKIYTAKFLLKRNLPVKDIGTILQQHPFFLNKFMNSVRRFSEPRLLDILKIIYALDYEQKTCGEESARLSLQHFIFQVRASKPGNKRY